MSRTLSGTIIQPLCASESTGRMGGGRDGATLPVGGSPSGWWLGALQASLPIAGLGTWPDVGPGTLRGQLPCRSPSLRSPAPRRAAVTPMPRGSTPSRVRRLWAELASATSCWGHRPFFWLPGGNGPLLGGAGRPRGSGPTHCGPCSPGSEGTRLGRREAGCSVRE